VGAVLVLAATDRGPQLGQRVGGLRTGLGTRSGRWGGGCDGLPHGVVDVGERGVGEPAEVGKVVVAGQPQTLAQAGDQEAAAAGRRGDVRLLPLPAERGQGSAGGVVPVGGGPAVRGVGVIGAQRGADGAVQVVGPDRTDPRRCSQLPGVLDMAADAGRE
jgi:hypothetical protein